MGEAGAPVVAPEEARLALERGHDPLARARRHPDLGGEGREVDPARRGLHALRGAGAEVLLRGRDGRAAAHARAELYKIKNDATRDTASYAQDTKESTLYGIL